MKELCRSASPIQYIGMHTHSRSQNQGSYMHLELGTKGNWASNLSPTRARGEAQSGSILNSISSSSLGIVLGLSLLILPSSYLHSSSFSICFLSSSGVQSFLSILYIWKHWCLKQMLKKMHINFIISPSLGNFIISSALLQHMPSLVRC